MKKKFVYLPEAVQTINTPSDTAIENRIKGGYPCPCCGYLTFPVPQNDAMAYVCPVCFWENDVFLTGEDEPSDENHGMTLTEARKNFQAFGACSEDMRIYVRKPELEEYPK